MAIDTTLFMIDRYDVTFVGMVLPRDELSVKLSHTGMRNGNMVIKVETTNQRGEKIIDGTAEVAQPPTVYVFTGQGSQEPGMGMDLYNSSPAARAVWDAADEHLLAVYGFSIIDIVKHNPKEKTIHFGGIKGQAIRQRYIDMTYDTLDKDGSVKTLPLFTDINIRTQQYTFSHPNDLLFATQFAWIALVVTGKAAFDDMRFKGLIQWDSAFAGIHSENTPLLHPLPTFSLSHPLLMSFSIVVSPCRALSSAIRKTGQTMLCVLLIQAASARPLTKLRSVRSSKSWVAAPVPYSRSSTTTLMVCVLLLVMLCWLTPAFSRDTG